MFYTSENNWYSWSYDNDTFGRQDITGKKFTTTFGKSSNKIGSFSDELRLAAQSTLDYYPSLKHSLLFSGGLDSEMILRSYLSVGYTPDVFIFRYENDYNIYDVSYAVTICSALGIDYNIIDFNLEKFYENDAVYYSEKAQIDRPRALPYCKFLEMIDGLPVLGASDLTLHRTTDDYSTKGNWIVCCMEHDIGWSKFVKEINKPAIAEWYKWTPGLVLSFLELEWCRNLVNDKYEGKLGTSSTKIIGYRSVYPDLIERKKKTGFEKIDHIVSEVEATLDKKYSGFPYRNISKKTISEVKAQILGDR